MLSRRSPRYEYPDQSAYAPVLPGVLLLLSEDVLIHVSTTGNLREELSAKGPRHHGTTHFVCEVIFDPQWRRARAAELAQLLTPPGRPLLEERRPPTMRFFIPAAEDAVQAERVYQSIRRFVAEQAGRLKDKRIYRIQFSHDGQQYDLAVGDRFQNLQGQPVIAILEGRRFYYVCTPNRGVVRGEPFLVAHEFTTHIEEFEPFTS